MVPLVDTEARACDCKKDHDEGNDKKGEVDGQPRSAFVPDEAAKDAGEKHYYDRPASHSYYTVPAAACKQPLQEPKRQRTPLFR
jgi:hypothetical protein